MWKKRLMWVGVGVGVGVGAGVYFSKPESESESEPLKFGRLRSPGLNRLRFKCVIFYNTNGGGKVPDVSLNSDAVDAFLSSWEETLHSDVIRPGGWPIFEKWYISEHEFQLFIRFWNVQGFQGHPAFRETPICISCIRLQSPMFVRTLSCRICRLKFRLSSRCNDTISIRQSFLLNVLRDSPMSCPRAGM